MQDISKKTFVKQENLDKIPTLTIMDTTALTTQRFELGIVVVVVMVKPSVLSANCYNQF